MFQVPQKASDSVCVRCSQAVCHSPEEWRHSLVDPEAFEGTHYPPAGSKTLQEAGAAAVDGERESQLKGQG